MRVRFRLTDDRESPSVCPIPTWPLRHSAGKLTFQLTELALDSALPIWRSPLSGLLGLLMTATPAES